MHQLLVAKLAVVASMALHCRHHHYHCPLRVAGFCIEASPTTMCSSRQERPALGPLIVAMCSATPGPACCRGDGGPDGEGGAVETVQTSVNEPLVRFHLYSFSPLLK